jgi:trimethylamine--corrinoid protein Co-methyltransferase
MPKVIDRADYESWKNQGSRDMFTRANERAREILEEHEVPPLPEEAEDVFADILAERAERASEA